MYTGYKIANKFGRNSVFYPIWTDVQNMACLDREGCSIYFKFLFVVEHTFPKQSGENINSPNSPSECCLEGNC